MHNAYIQSLLCQGQALAVHVLASSRDRRLSLFYTCNAMSWSYYYVSSEMDEAFSVLLCINSGFIYYESHMMFYPVSHNILPVSYNVLAASAFKEVRCKNYKYISLAPFCHCTNKSVVFRQCSHFRLLHDTMLT